MTVKIKKDDFVLWWMTDNDKTYDIAIQALLLGYKPVQETIKTSKEFFNLCGFLPFRFIDNIDDIKSALDEAYLLEEELDSAIEFNVEWV